MARRAQVRCRLEGLPTTKDLNLGTPAVEVLGSVPARLRGGRPRRERAGGPLRRNTGPDRGDRSSAQLPAGGTCEQKVTGAECNTPGLVFGRAKRRFCERKRGNKGSVRRARV